MKIDIFIIRILLCFILSILIGLERQYRHKTIGLRTNVLVCLGAFMFVYSSFYSTNIDTTRIAAQVVSGIGFLGAGVIIKDGNKVKGLNTAATLWCVASIGVLTAFGMLLESIIGTVFILLSNIILRLLSEKLMNKLKDKQTGIIKIKCDYIEEVVIKKLVIKLVDKYNLYIKRYEKNSISNNEIELNIYINFNEKFYFDEIIKIITTSANINSIYLELINEDIIDEE